MPGHPRRKGGRWGACSVVGLHVQARLQSPRILATTHSLSASGDMLEAPVQDVQRSHLGFYIVTLTNSVCSAVCIALDATPRRSDVTVQNHADSTPWP